jgi:hypothetical protein
MADPMNTCIYQKCYRLKSVRVLSKITKKADRSRALSTSLVDAWRAYTIRDPLKNMPLCCYNTVYCQDN